MGKAEKVFENRLSLVILTPLRVSVRLRSEDAGGYEKDDCKLTFSDQGLLKSGS
jgi:hypothetical protein